ncbi:MAG: GNAT family N-acetyltransferase [Devosiaceae bacterium]|nr:GNAT family N-acetyltransferase [Devosiaceae bacterium MH13]
MTPPIPKTLTIDDEGFAVVPAGLQATIETSLERTTPPRPDLYPLPAGYKLVHPDPADLSVFKRLYHAVGDPWLWFGRLLKGDDYIRSVMTAPETTLRYLVDPSGQEVGLVETQKQGMDTLEVTYFGLVPEATGKGLGPAMMEHGVAAAWSADIRRTWLHTCTFDSPFALTFYRRQGFVPYLQRIEIGTDPRLTGALPRTAAPHIPLADFSEP